MESKSFVPVQKLFLIAFTLKCALALAGWYFQRPWSLGFVAPLAVMGWYIFVGSRRGDTAVSDEKFADSCYYLGFMFTVVSIVFGLFDIPQIGERIQDIAVRFGAAMLTTVLGLFVRVYLVSFRPDATDAVRTAEEALVDAAGMLQQHLETTVERLNSFGAQVDAATAHSIERMNMQVEALSRNHADKLAEFYKGLTDEVGRTTTASVGAIEQVSATLANTLTSYAERIDGQLGKLESDAQALSEALIEKVRASSLPSDLFTAELRQPLSDLVNAVDQTAEAVGSARRAAQASGASLSRAIRALDSKLGGAEPLFDQLANLAEQHEALLSGTRGQLEASTRVAEAAAVVSESLEKAKTLFESQVSSLERLETEATRRSERERPLMAEIMAVAEALRQSAAETRELAAELTESRKHAGAVPSHAVPASGQPFPGDAPASAASVEPSFIAREPSALGKPQALGAPSTADTAPAADVTPGLGQSAPQPAAPGANKATGRGSWLPFPRPFR